MQACKRIVKNLICLTLPFTLWACSYNPMVRDNHLTGSGTGTAVGAAVGAGGAAALGVSDKAYLGLAGIGGGAIGYYVTTLRYDAGGIYRGGGKVYKVGDYVGIYLPTDQIFEPNSADFKPEAHSILDSTVTVLNRYPTNNILISGNTSGFDRPKRERALSLARARAVSSYLWKSGVNDFKNPGIETRKLNYVGYGDYFPIASPQTNKGIRQNSRIQITSYPCKADLGLGKRRMVFNNVGGMDDAPRPAKDPKCAASKDGSCMDIEV